MSKIINTIWECLSNIPSRILISLTSRGVRFFSYRALAKSNSADSSKNLDFRKPGGIFVQATSVLFDMLLAAGAYLLILISFPYMQTAFDDVQSTTQTESRPHEIIQTFWDNLKTHLEHISNADFGVLLGLVGVFLTLVIAAIFAGRSFLGSVSEIYAAIFLVGYMTCVYSIHFAVGAFWDDGKVSIENASSVDACVIIVLFFVVSKLMQAARSSWIGLRWRKESFDSKVEKIDAEIQLLTAAENEKFGSAGTTESLTEEGRQVDSISNWPIVVQSAAIILASIMALVIFFQAGLVALALYLLLLVTWYAMMFIVNWHFLPWRIRKTPLKKISMALLVLYWAAMMYPVAAGSSYAILLWVYGDQAISPWIQIIFVVLFFVFTIWILVTLYRINNAAFIKTKELYAMEHKILKNEKNQTQERSAELMEQQKILK